MPLIKSSSYQKPFYYINGHAETILPSLLRKINGVTYERERLELADGDFLDLDWLSQKRKKLVLISHGLEGNSERHYCKGMAKYFFLRDWDALAWNCRSCSGEINRLPRFYHHGATEDIACVIDHAIKKGYETISLVGFSMGGSMTLKYMGENSHAISPHIQSAVVFSVPCHLGSSAKELDKPSRSFYRNRFLKKLQKKMVEKENLFPNIISAKHFEKIKTFKDFDTIYTAPLHGFKDSEDFYERASSGQFIPYIKKPTLIVNAANDPFLPDECYPKEVASKHDWVTLEIPKHGGHVGFSLARQEENWMEQRAFDFIAHC